VFIPHTIATLPTHLISAAVGDIDGDGCVDIVTSGMYGFPPFDRTGRVNTLAKPTFPLIGARLAPKTLGVKLHPIGSERHVPFSVPHALEPSRRLPDPEELTCDRTVSSMTVFCPIWDNKLSYIVSDGIIRFPVCPAKREVASGSLRRYLKALARERDLRPSKRKTCPFL